MVISEKNISVAEVLTRSSNVGAYLLAKRVGKNAITIFLRDVGFGGGQVLGLSDEATGVLRHHQDWRREDFATHAYGYGFSTTLIQLLRAYSIFSSDGLLVEPRLVSAGKPFVRRKISAQTAKRIRRVMQGVTKGTAPKASVFGYQVAGKTGTAYKFVNGQYDTSRRRTFFVGMAPAENRVISLPLWLMNRPKTGIAAVRRRRRYLAKLCGGRCYLELCRRSLSMPEPFNAAAVVARMGSHPTALSSDSRRIGKNCAFLAYPGDVFDGRGFIPDALSAGAVGIFWEAENFVWLSDWSVPNVAVPRLHLHVGDIADTVYHSPSENFLPPPLPAPTAKQPSRILPLSYAVLINPPSSAL